jgi:hypothetical protein
MHYPIRGRCVVAELQKGRWGLQIPAGARDFLLFETSVLAVRPTQSHSQCILGFNTAGKTAGALINTHSHLVSTLRICASKKRIPFVASRLRYQHKYKYITNFIFVIFTVCIFLNTSLPLPSLNDAYENNRGSRVHCNILSLYILCWIPGIYLDGRECTPGEVTTLTNVSEHLLNEFLYFVGRSARILYLLWTWECCIQ